MPSQFFPFALAVLFIIQLSLVDPSEKDLNPKTDNLNTSIQLHILKSLKDLNCNITDLKSEMTAVKCELSEYKQLNKENEQKIKKLETENEYLQMKVDYLETRTRSNTLILSGASLNNIRDNASPNQLLDMSVKNIKDTFDFNLRKDDVMDCRKLTSRFNQSSSILITLANSFIKNDLMSTVIEKDKSEGINLNVNEFLSTKSANLLYKLRTLKKKNKEKIYCCFANMAVFFIKFGRILNQS